MLRKAREKGEERESAVEDAELSSVQNGTGNELEMETQVWLADREELGAV